MKELILQRKGDAFLPFDPESAELMRDYYENQPVRAKTTGIKKPRSYQQLKLYWKMCELVADHFDEFRDKYDADWEARIKLRHYDRMTVDGNQIMVEVKSISYSNLGHAEANRFFDRAFELFAKWLGVEVGEIIRQCESA